MGTLKLQRKGVPPWLVRGACHASTRYICPALTAPIAQYKICFSSPYTISIHLSSSPSKLDRQSCWVASVLVCLWSALMNWSAGHFRYHVLKGHHHKILKIWFLFWLWQVKVGHFRLSPSPSKLDRQLCWVASVLVCLWSACTDELERFKGTPSQDFWRTRFIFWLWQVKVTDMFFPVLNTFWKPWLVYGMVNYWWWLIIQSWESLPLPVATPPPGDVIGREMVIS